MLTETLWEALDAIVDLPLYLLTIIGVILVGAHCIDLGDRFASFIDVSPVVNCADEVVNDLKKLSRVSTEV